MLGAPAFGKADELVGAFDFVTTLMRSFSDDSIPAAGVPGVACSVPTVHFAAGIWILQEPRRHAIMSFCTITHL
jgi:hypothetical protein